MQADWIIATIHIPVVENDQAFTLQHGGGGEVPGGFIKALGAVQGCVSSVRRVTAVHLLHCQVSNHGVLACKVQQVLL